MIFGTPYIKAGNFWHYATIDGCVDEKRSTVGIISPSIPIIRQSEVMNTGSDSLDALYNCSVAWRFAFSDQNNYSGSYTVRSVFDYVVRCYAIKTWNVSTQAYLNGRE